MSENTISGIILSGGRGSRMQGRDKGWVVVDGKALVEHVIERVAAQVDDIVISANRNLERYSGTGYPVCRDLQGDFEGPLAGIRACLPHTRHDYILVTAVDMPYLPADLAPLLRRRLNGEKLAVVAVASRLQAVFVMHKCLLHSVERSLAAGQRSLMQWIRTTPHAIVERTDERAFANINRLEQIP